MNVISRLADTTAQCDIARAVASRNSWRRLAKGLGRKVRAQRHQMALRDAQIAHQNTVIQQQADDIRRTQGSADRWRVKHEDATAALRRAQAHLNVCDTAQAVADHDLEKAREAAS